MANSSVLAQKSAGEERTHCSTVSTGTLLEALVGE
jgi:hypothetical protein